MKKIGFITCEKYAGLSYDEHYVLESFEKADIKIIPLVWDKPIDYDFFDLLVFRSAWDYHQKINSFINFLQVLKKINTPIYNPISIIEQNYDKYYLKSLQNKGFSIIPTLFFDSVETINLKEILRLQNWQKAVIKPAISMSAYQTYTFDNNNAAIIQNQLTQHYGNTKVMVQKFANEIMSEGEWSIIFYDKQYCMSALKTPKKGEFRVQSELGGSISYQDPPKHIIAEAKSILDNYQEDILYSRIDGIIHKGHFQLMEIELIDPELYFRAGEKGRIAFLKSVKKRL